jgi:two-component system chemotaxis response regulator CheB
MGSKEKREPDFYTDKRNFDFDDVIIAIGASTGGTEAISHILKNLPPEIPGIVIVQHMPAGFTKMFAERLDGLCRLNVKEAQDGDGIIPGTVLIAPGNYHVKVEQRRKNKLYIRCFRDKKVNGHCPSIDVLFDSVASLAKPVDAIGVILTGMGKDGANGLLNMKKNGAYTIGQDEKSSVVYGMPMASYEIGAVQKQVHIDNIPSEIMKILKKISEKRQADLP